jgi:uncharacterized protein (TIGR03083 family)
MSLSRTSVIDGFLDSAEVFAELVAGLRPDQWTAPTRCEGWRVCDVAAHVVGIAEDVAKGTTGQRTPEDQVAALSAESPERLATELRGYVDGMRPVVQALDEAAWEGPSPVPEMSMRVGVLTLWHELYLHADDIRAAIGYPSLRGEGLQACVERVVHELEKQGWGPARLELDGVPAIAIGGGDGGGRVVSGDALQFALIATGREQPAAMGLPAEVNIYR